MTKSTAALLVSLVLGVGTASLGSVSQGAARSLSITAHLTADNHYALYHGNADASDLTLVGRNEVGYAGSTGGAPWNVPETWTFDVFLHCKSQREKWR